MPVVGRYVLLFQTDPAETLRSLARQVWPGGLLVFHEPDWVSARSIPPAPIYDSCCPWIRDTFRIAGTDGNMAGKLYAAFVGAGLSAPFMRMQTFIGGGAACADILQAVADLIDILVPTMERQGVATASEVDVRRLGTRIEDCHEP